MLTESLVNGLFINESLQAEATFNVYGLCECTLLITQQCLDKQEVVWRGQTAGERRLVLLARHACWARDASRGQ